MEKRGKKVIAFLLTLALIFSMGTVSTVFAAGQGTVVSEITVTYGQTEARTMLDMINQFRTGDDTWAWAPNNQDKDYYENLGELTYDPVLERVAMQRAAEIALSFSHIRPNGEQCWTAFPSGYIAWGENIAAGAVTAEEAFLDWREDKEDYDGQGHRRNMLGSDFTAVGIGHVIYNGRDYWVQEFGSPASGEAVSAAVDGEQTVSVEVPDVEETVTGVSPANSHIYYGSNNTAEILQAYAATLTTAAVATDTGKTYSIAAQWQYDPASNSFKILDGSYTLPVTVTDPNGLMSQGVPLEKINGGFDTDYSNRNSFTLHEGGRLRIELDPVYNDGSILSWSWYKLEDGKLTPISGSGKVYEKAEVTPEDAGQYVAVYGIHNGLCICRVKIVTVSAHTPVTDESTVTCTQAGLTEGSHCSVCKKVLVAQKEVPALGHDWDDGKITTEAACEKEGVKTYTCTRCQETKTEKIPALEHKAVVDPEKEPTCTEPGLTEGSHCDLCGKVLVAQKEIPALGHDWDDGKITTEAACEKEGVKTYICARCQETKTEKIPALEHKVVQDPGKEPTCTEPGLTEGSHCDLCGMVLEEQKEIPATGHTSVVDKATATCTEPGLTEGSHCSVCEEVLVKQEQVPALGHDWDAGTIVKEATCQEKGEISFTCNRCGDTKTEVIPALQHKVVEDSEKPATCTESGEEAGTHCEVCGEILSGHKEIPAAGHSVIEDPEKPATCTVPGEEAGTHCEVCGEILSGHGEIPVLDHIWDEGKITKEPTCSALGEKTYTCASCGTTRTEEVEKLPHTPQKVEAVAPTCTNSGLTEGSVCGVCGITLTPQEIVAALGHLWDQGAVAKTPTCTEEGAYTYTCQRCGETMTKALDAAGHTEEVIPGKPATCTEPGLTDGKICSVCQAVLEEQQVIPAAGHSWNDGEVQKEAECTQDGKIQYTCTVCGETRIEAISANGHIEEVLPGVAATCTETGLTEGIKCSVCGTILQAQTEIPAAGHNVVTDIKVNATCTKPGLTEGSHCSVCQEVFQAQEEIPALGHSWDKGIVTIKATYTEEGLKTFTCESCGETRTETIPVLVKPEKQDDTIKNDKTAQQDDTEKKDNTAQDDKDLVKEQSKDTGKASEEKDKQGVTAKGEAVKQEKDTKAVKTGDETEVLPLLFLSGVSVLVAGLILFDKRKKYDK